ncbi:hypothetical protein LC092_11260 [Stappia stellulata]|uniref:hypothetical protein n=1 Tax=Stappia stellulata TaxID=71235 RepID=UPI001CD19648|nr:hypothetical protein [Stappia stellulata]MCA1243016.1 hypothetical protein [Stappia stellulata]
MPTDYSAFADLLDTYQSLSDGLQLAWLVVPPVFLLGSLALVLRYRLACRRTDCLAGGRLAYTVFAEENGRLQVIAYDDTACDDANSNLKTGVPRASSRS